MRIQYHRGRTLCLAEFSNSWQSMWLFSSVQSLSHVWLFATHGLQHARLPCPSPTPRACSNSCLSSQWCHPTISSSVIPFSSCLPFFPASGSFQMSQFFASGGQNIGVSASASVLPMSIQDWFPLEWTDWISLQSKRHRYGRRNFHLSDTVLNHVRFTKLLFLHLHCSLLYVFVNGNKFIYIIYLK